MTAHQLLRTVTKRDFSVAYSRATASGHSPVARHRNTGIAKELDKLQWCAAGLQSFVARDRR